MYIWQQSRQTVHHFWARFLLVMTKVKDCREEDTISFFCKYCTGKGILNAISRRDISRFADLASIVWKYVQWKVPGKPKRNFGLIRLWICTQSEVKGCIIIRHPSSLQRNKNPLQGTEPYWRDGLTDPAKFIAQRIQYQPTALEHVGYSGRWPKVVRIYSSQKPQSTIPRTTIRC